MGTELGEKKQPIVPGPLLSRSQAESWSFAEYGFGNFPKTQSKKSVFYSGNSGESKMCFWEEEELD